MNKQILNRPKEEVNLQNESSEEYKAYCNIEDEYMQSEEPIYLVNEVW